MKYHKGYSNDRRTASGAVVHLSLTANPSHLEAVDPVVEGRVRAKQMRQGDFEGAVEAYREVAADQPENRFPWIEIAKIQHDNLALLLGHHRLNLILTANG